MLKEKLTQKEVEERDEFYRWRMLSGELKEALENTRKEPGSSLRDVSNIIKKVYSKEEVESLIKELKNYGQNRNNKVV